MKAILYTIECISNMHVGSGKDNFGVIDRLIQRDPITNYPCINASGLKGALLEHCKHNGLSEEYTNIIFGVEGKKGDKDKKEKDTPSKQGNYRFLDAHLLSLSVPDNNAPYKLITSKGIVTELATMAKNLCISLDDNKIKEIDGCGEIPQKTVTFDGYVGDDKLPVISRNNLDNGVSKNLWYEQVLPRKSRLYFFVLCDNDVINGDTYKIFEAFNEAITGPVVQIGANATIGYGLCKITKVCESSKKSEL